MKKVLFLTNYPSPYRVQFFDELGQHCDLTVLLSDRREEETCRDPSWFAEGTANFHMIQLQSRAAKHHGEALCVDVLRWINRSYDAIFVCGYSSPTAMLAMQYLKFRRIPFFMEVDGGLIRGDSPAVKWLKTHFVSSADGWVSSGRSTTDFLVHYGAKREKVTEYPFSSLRQGDILAQPVSEEERMQLRRELGMEEKNVILAVGQFIPRKGFDVLLQSAPALPEDTGIYIVGGEPTEEYLKMREENHLEHVHFVGFRGKDVLSKYYRAADVFTLPTREDIWGLVINEAMAYGLPVVTTDRCVAGLELVENGVNGYIVPVENAAVLAEKLNLTLENCRAMGAASLEKIRPYTIENMVQTHLQILKG